jgi:outer membrane protein OmpA-like peptidoglycan-associated protein
MSDQEADQRVAFWIVGVVVAVIVAAVLTFGACSLTEEAAPPEQAPSQVNASEGSMAEADAPDAIGDPLAVVYFEVGNAILNADMEAEVAKVADAVKVSEGKIVLVSGFHDASGCA